MELDEMLRREIRAIRLPFDREVEAAAICKRTRRRRALRRLAAVPVGTAAAAAIAVGAIALQPVDDPDVYLSTDTTTNETATDTTITLDPLEATGVCRSLLPSAFDPLDPPVQAGEPPTTAPGAAPAIEYPQAMEPEADTPCGEAVAADLLARVDPGWMPWEDNPFDQATVSESAPPNGYGTVAVSFVDSDGALLQVNVGYAPPLDDVAPFPGFGRPLDDLPEGWVGTTTFVAGEDRRTARVTVVRPGRLPVLVSVQLGQPSMGAPQPEGTVLPMTFDEVRDLAIDIAESGPVKSP